MRVLIVCESLPIKLKLDAAIKEKGCKNTYKVVACGNGKMNAAAMTALEVSAVPYDLVVSTGEAVGGPFIEPDTIVFGNKVAQWDVHSPVEIEDGKTYDIGGIDDITILSGDDALTTEAYSDVVTLFGKSVCFDTITFGINNIVRDYDIDMLAIKYTGKIGSIDAVVPIITYLEGIE